jgi:hypothetical protein
VGEGEREREKEREREVSPEWIPRGRHPQPGLLSIQKAQLVSQASLC